MKIKDIPIEKIKRAAYNPRVLLKPGDPAFDRMSKTLDKFGLVEPLVWNERSGNLIEGHQRLTYLEARGDKLVKCSVLDVSDKDEKTLNLALNKHSGEWDDDALRTLLTEINVEDFDIEVTGFTDKELSDLLFNSDDVDLAAVPQLFSDERIIDEAFAYYRKLGFPYKDLPAHICLQEINALAAITDPETLRNSTTAYSVADTFHPHRFHATVDQKKSPVDGFNSDKLLRRALAFTLEHSALKTGYFGALSVVSGVQGCSNFRPGFAAWIYRRFCKPGSRVLDTRTGYGGRLVGAIASGVVAAYTGIDPNTTTHAANLKMFEILAPASIDLKLINKPAEDVAFEEIGGEFDLAFTSPPYFTKEHYSSEPTQSFNRYPEAKAWREQFLRKMIALQCAAVKSEGRIVINIGDVNIREKKHPLIEWTIEEADDLGLDLEAKETFDMVQMPGANLSEDANKSEALLIFKKR